MTALAVCANNGRSGNDGDGDDDDDRDRAFAPKIDVHAASSIGRLGGDPVRLAVSTAAPSIVGLRIYDAAGRLVAEPMRNSLVSGTVEVRWDGRSMRGGLVAPGNYFYRATSGNEASSGRIVIIR